jgi:hypothetical protein
MYISLGISTKTRFLTVDLHIHYICLLICVRYIILFIVYNYKTVKTGLPRCTGESIFFGGGEVRGQNLGKVRSTSSCYEARFEVISVPLLKIRVFWYCGLLGTEYESTMMLRSVAY